MNVLLYGSEVRRANLLSLDDRIVIVDETRMHVLCDISENCYYMLRDRGYIVEIHELKNIDNNLYNIISRMTGLS
jgi:hypothetical protein